MVVRLIVNNIGRGVILSGNFTSSDRYMNKNCYDSVAIVRAIRKPDIFISKACNLKCWTSARIFYLTGNTLSARFGCTRVSCEIEGYRGFNPCQGSSLHLRCRIADTWNYSCIYWTQVTLSIQLPISYWLQQVCICCDSRPNVKVQIVWKSCAAHNERSMWSGEKRQVLRKRISANRNGWTFPRYRTAR